MLKQFLKDEAGATAIEYVLLVALIAVALIGTLTSLRDTVDGTLQDATNALENARATGDSSTGG